MTGSRGRSMLFAASLALFACLLLSGAQRLIGSQLQGGQSPAAAPAQAYLCSASPAYVLSTEDGSRDKAGEYRDSVDALPAGRPFAQPRGARADANGNVIASGISYLRSVYQAFALGDGFA